jgi:hypothetical protein
MCIAFSIFLIGLMLTTYHTYHKRRKSVISSHRRNLKVLIIVQKDIKNPRYPRTTFK